jgi:periplasmic protein TonB
LDVGNVSPTFAENRKRGEMLDRLLESKSRRARSPMGAVTSIGAHLAVIVVAIHATAQSRPRPRSVETQEIVPFVVKSPPSPPVLSHTAQTKRLGAPVTPDIRITFDPKIPPIDFTPTSTSPSDFTSGLATSSTVGSPVSTSAGNGTFNADQVEKQVALLAGAPIPSYPEALSAAGVEGKVVAQFIVDERGRVESDSIRFLQSDNSLFEASVRNVLRRMRFVPAEIGGKKVRQLVQMPFVFTIARH